jgi:hypothetical protein
MPGTSWELRWAVTDRQAGPRAFARGGWVLTQYGLTTRVYVHPVLSPQTATGVSLRWYNDQNGFGSGSCTSSSVATMLSEVRRHEGVPPVASNSHQGHLAQALPSAAFPAVFERSYGSSKQMLKARADSAWLGWRGPWLLQERQWDSSETAGWATLLKCIFDADTLDAG